LTIPSLPSRLLEVFTSAFLFLEHTLQIKKKKKEKFLVCDLIGPKGVYLTHGKITLIMFKVNLLFSFFS